MPLPDTDDPPSFENLPVPAYRSLVWYCGREAASLLPTLSAKLRNAICGDTACLESLMFATPMRINLSQRPPPRLRRRYWLGKLSALTRNGSSLPQPASDVLSSDSPVFTAAASSDQALSPLYHEQQRTCSTSAQDLISRDIGRTHIGLPPEMDTEAYIREYDRLVAALQWVALHAEGPSGGSSPPLSGEDDYSGYCQGMNFVTSILLAGLRAGRDAPEDRLLVEEVSCLRTIFVRYRMFVLYELTERFKSLLWSLDRLSEFLVAEALPLLVLHGERVSADFFASSWFLTIFTADLASCIDEADIDPLAPIGGSALATEDEVEKRLTLVQATDAALRFMDVFIYQGWPGVVSISLELIRLWAQRRARQTEKCEMHLMSSLKNAAVDAVREGGVEVVIKEAMTRYRPLITEELLAELEAAFLSQRTVMLLRDLDSSRLICCDCCDRDSPAAAAAAGSLSSPSEQSPSLAPVRASGGSSGFRMVSSLKIPTAAAFFAGRSAPASRRGSESGPLPSMLMDSMKHNASDAEQQSSKRRTSASMVSSVKKGLKKSAKSMGLTGKRHSSSHASRKGGDERDWLPSKF